MTVAIHTRLFSFSSEARPIIAGSALLSIMIAFALFSLSIGSYPLSLSHLLQGLTGHLTGVDDVILRDHRLPRILVAIGAGAAFGIAGAMFQTMLRNPLASPDVIGFTAGANLGALLAVLTTGTMIMLGALVGGLATACLVILLAWHKGVQTNRLILVGIGVSLTLGAGADLVMSWMDERIAADMARWLSGSLNTRSYQDVRLIWIGIAVLSPALLWLQFPLARMALSEDTIVSLGFALSPLRLAVTATGVALVALAVSVAGPLPFVSFVSGPIARRIVGGGHPSMLAAACIGAIVTLGADLAARSVPLIQLPAGVFTGLIGAPVLLWLLSVQFRKGKV